MLTQKSVLVALGVLDSPMCEIKMSKLTILTGKNCFELNSVQEFIEIEAWLLLTFFLCLHYQLISVHSTVTH